MFLLSPTTFCCGVTTKNYSIYAMREYTTTNDEKSSIYATRKYTTIFDLHDAYYSFLERYMKHVFVASLVTGDFFSENIANSIRKFFENGGLTLNQGIF